MTFAVRHIYDLVVNEYSVRTSKPALEGVTVGAVTSLACAEDCFDRSRTQALATDYVVLRVNDI